MWNGPFSGMMDGWGGWAWPFMGLFPLLFPAAVIAAVVWLVRYSSGAGGNPRPTERRSRGLDALEERYARGEIGRDEYLQKKTDIGG